MSMPRAVRHINEVRVLASLYRLGVSTRADLARELSLTRSTVGNLVSGLAQRGLLLETEVTGSTPGGRTGRPGQHVELNPSHSAVLGADIGVGHLSVVAVDLTGRLVHSTTVDYAAPTSDVDQTLRRLSELIRKTTRSLPASQVVQGLCVAVPGLVERDGSVVLRAPVIGWKQVPVPAQLRSMLKWQGALTLENDANAFAAAEVFGRPGLDAGGDALFAYLDAGVGGGIVSQGKMLRGFNGYAGEIGHVPVGDTGYDPQAAIPGSLESYVGRNALLARYRHHRGGGRDWASFIADLAARRAAAMHAATDWAWWMGRGLAALISVLNPGRVILGGPVGQVYRAVQPEVEESVRRHMALPYPLPSISLSDLGGDACALGCAMMLHRSLLDFDERLVFGLDETRQPATAEPRWLLG